MKKIPFLIAVIIALVLTGLAQPSFAAVATNLYDPVKKEIAQELVSSAENSTLDWRSQFAYIEDIGDGRGYTGGIIGFCSGTGDMLQVISLYTQKRPGNVLAKYIPVLQTKRNMDPSHTGLDPTFVGDWKAAAADPAFQEAQTYKRDAAYFIPAVNIALGDGLHALGQFMYYDAAMTHGFSGGSGTFDGISFESVRAASLAKAKPPAQGGNEVAYLNAYLDARRAAMMAEPAHVANVTRIDTEQRKFLSEGNLDLTAPLTWQTYGETYAITK